MRRSRLGLDDADLAEPVRLVHVEIGLDEDDLGARQLRVPCVDGGGQLGVEVLGDGVEVLGDGVHAIPELERHILAGPGVSRDPDPESALVARLVVRLEELRVSGLVDGDAIDDGFLEDTAPDGDQERVQCYAAVSE